MDSLQQLLKNKNTETKPFLIGCPRPYAEDNQPVSCMLLVVVLFITTLLKIWTKLEWEGCIDELVIKFSLYSCQV